MLLTKPLTSAPLVVSSGKLPPLSQHWLRLHASVRSSSLCSIRDSALKLFPSKRWETNQSLGCIMQERTHLIGIAPPRCVKNAPFCIINEAPALSSNYSGAPAESSWSLQPSA